MTEGVELTQKTDTWVKSGGTERVQSHQSEGVTVSAVENIGWWEGESRGCGHLKWKT
jgi:hypothetical protein